MCIAYSTTRLDHLLRGVLFCSQGVWVTEDGTVVEAANSNVAIVTSSRELVIGNFDHCLDGCTAKRLLDILPEVGLLWGAPLRV